MTEATLVQRTQVRPVMRFVRIVCPECDCAQGAAIFYPPGGVEVREHECIYCGYWIEDEDWQEVPDDLD